MRFLLVLASLALLARPVHAQGPEQRVLDLVNHYRGQVGLPPVKLDAKLSRGCMEHAEYMRLNAGTPAMVGLAAHTQDPSLPGATAAGAACGKAADLFPGVADLGAAVDAWMSGLYHRRPILTPGLATIGVGYARTRDGSLMAALMFVDGPDADDTRARWPVGYPARDQTGVPLEFGNEIPNPIPGGGAGGYPITLQFPPFDEVTGVRATLVDAATKAVPFYLSTPAHPATSFGQYGVICLIPKTPMRPNARYTASVTATWQHATKTWTWSFTTIGLAPLDGNDEAAVTRAVGTPSLVRGIVRYGGMMNTETVFLALSGGTDPRAKMVSVIIPTSVWGKRGKPEAMTGKTIEVEATPQLVKGSYLNLPVTVSSQLRIVKP